MEQKANQQEQKAQTEKRDQIEKIDQDGQVWKLIRRNSSVTSTKRKRKFR